MSTSCQLTNLGSWRRWSRTGDGASGPGLVPAPFSQSNPLGYPNPIEMVRRVDDANEWLKDNTYLDMMGWKDVVVLGAGMASEQIRILGFTADAFVKETPHGPMVVLRTDTRVDKQLIEIGFLESNPVIAHAGFKFTPKEFAEDATRAVAIGIVCLVVWDVVHECLQDHFDSVRLGVTIASDILKTVGTAAAGVVVAAMLPVGAPVVFVFVMVTVMSTAAAMGFQVLDSQFKLTEKLTVFIRDLDENTSGRLYRFIHRMNESIKAVCYENMMQLTNDATAY